MTVLFYFIRRKKYNVDRMDSLEKLNPNFKKRCTLRIEKRAEREWDYSFYLLRILKFSSA
jgi:hypothetical protein